MQADLRGYDHQAAISADIMPNADRDRWQRFSQKSADELKQQIARIQPRRQPLSRSAQPEPEMA